MGNSLNPKKALNNLFKAFFFVCILSSCQSTKHLEPTRSNLNELSQTSSKLSQKKNRHTYKHLAESALLNFYKKQYKESEAFHQKAWSFTESAYTRSVSQLILSKIINENTKDFRGHYLERWQMLMMSSINYLAQNKVSDALVELRRLSQDCRLKKDPYEEVRLEKCKHRYLLQTGILFCLLGRSEEGKVDLRYAESLNETIPSWLKEQSWYWNNKPMPKNYIRNNMSLQNPKSLNSLLLQIHLEGQAPKKKEQRLNITMFNYLPIVNAYTEGKGEPDEANQITDIMTGTLGKRLIEIAYPILETKDVTNPKNKNEVSLNFGELYHKSWDAQKNRLIAQSIIRVASKVWASYQVEDAVEKAVEGPWGMI